MELILTGVLCSLCFTLYYFAENGETYSLLITPESMLLSHGGRVTFLPGIPRSNSKFSAPELNQSGQCVTEKVK